MNKEREFLLVNHIEVFFVCLRSFNSQRIYGFSIINPAVCKYLTVFGIKKI